MPEIASVLICGSYLVPEQIGDYPPLHIPGKRFLPLPLFCSFVQLLRARAQRIMRI